MKPEEERRPGNFPVVVICCMTQNTELILLSANLATPVYRPNWNSFISSADCFDAMLTAVLFSGKYYIACNNCWKLVAQQHNGWNAIERCVVGEKIILEKCDLHFLHLLNSNENIHLSFSKKRSVTYVIF